MCSVSDTSAELFRQKRLTQITGALSSQNALKAQTNVSLSNRARTNRNKKAAGTTKNMNANRSQSATYSANKNSADTLKKRKDLNSVANERSQWGTWTTDSNGNRRLVEDKGWNPIGFEV